MSNVQPFWAVITPAEVAQNLLSVLGSQDPSCTIASTTCAVCNRVVSYTVTHPKKGHLLGGPPVPGPGGECCAAAADPQAFSKLEQALAKKLTISR